MLEPGVSRALAVFSEIAIRSAKLSPIAAERQALQAIASLQAQNCWSSYGQMRGLDSIKGPVPNVLTMIRGRTWSLAILRRNALAVAKR